MRAKLRYRDCDDNNVFRVLSKNNVDILKTKQNSCDSDAYVTILVDNRQNLNELLYELNCECCYGVQLMRTSKIKKCDSCKCRDCCSDIRKLFHVLCK